MATSSHLYEQLALARRTSRIDARWATITGARAATASDCRLGLTWRSPSDQVSPGADSRLHRAQFSQTPLRTAGCDPLARARRAIKLQAPFERLDCLLRSIQSIRTEPSRVDDRRRV